MRSHRVPGFAFLSAALLAVAQGPAHADMSAEAASRGNPDVRSHAFYVLDGTEDSVIAARHEHTPVPIASITKLMTAMVVLDAGQPMEEILSITREDVHGTAGSGSRLGPGARMSRGDLMHVALMSSDNRAAHALCRRYPGGLDACVRAMNDKAGELGMASARFEEPTGLSSRNVASPEDLAKLVLAAGRDPTIRLFSTDPDHSFFVNGQRIDFRNTNLLVDKPDWEVMVQKTGYISEAGRCLVMQAVIDGREVVIVLLNSWGKLTRIADAQRIRSWMQSQRPRSES